MLSEIGKTTAHEAIRQRIQTTLGDLIAAIADAADEATISEDELSGTIHEVLGEVLRNRQK